MKEVLQMYLDKTKYHLWSHEPVYSWTIKGCKEPSVKSNLKKFEYKKSLKIPKGLPEAWNQRTDHTMTNKKEQKHKQWSTKHYTENKRLNNTNPT